jgi:hypothetical protein
VRTACEHSSEQLVRQILDASGVRTSRADHVVAERAVAFHGTLTLHLCDEHGHRRQHGQRMVCGTV